MEKRIITILEQHTQILGEHTKKLEEHDQKFDRVFNKLLDHDARFERIEENMATKQELSKVINTLDKFVGLYVKTDQEQVFMGQRISRVENDVEKIKLAVKLA